MSVVRESLEIDKNLMEKLIKTKTKKKRNKLRSKSVKVTKNYTKLQVENTKEKSK